MSNTVNKAYVFTINNYTDDDLTALDLLETDARVRYAILGFEEGANGTPHIQGYLELHKAMRLKAVVGILGGRAFAEKRKGTRDQARNYCQKDGTFHEIGEWNTKGQGHRSDLQVLMEDVKKNVPKRETMEKMPECYSRHLKFVGEYRAVVERDDTREFRNVSVHVLWGDSGVGKTRYVAEKEKSLFWVHPDDAFPFDGYDGEEAIAFDDFYGNMKHHQMLRILDGYQLPVNIKGGMRYARWTRVYITSNKQPSEWYAMGLGALERRLTSVTHMEAPNGVQADTEKQILVTVTPPPADSICQSTLVTKMCNEVVGNNSATTSGVCDPTPVHESVTIALQSANNIAPPVHKKAPLRCKYTCDICGKEGTFVETPYRRRKPHPSCEDHSCVMCGRGTTNKPTWGHLTGLPVCNGCDRRD